MTNIQARNIKKYSIPAEALISRSFKTGILYPSTVSPNCFNFLILLSSFWSIFGLHKLPSSVHGLTERGRAEGPPLMQIYAAATGSFVGFLPGLLRSMVIPSQMNQAT